MNQFWGDISPDAAGSHKVAYYPAAKRNLNNNQGPPTCTVQAKNIDMIFGGLLSWNVPYASSKTFLLKFPL
jgi:hypothetical protein